MAYALNFPHASRTRSEGAEVPAARPGVLRRIMNALMEAQMERARREVARHAPFTLQSALENGDFRTLSRTGRLPFKG